VLLRLAVGLVAVGASLDADRGHLRRDVVERSMRWDESPRVLLNAAVASAVLSVAFVLASRWDHAGYGVGAALLALLCVLFVYRAWEFWIPRQLDDQQREQLRLRLLGVPPPVDVRIVAVPDGKAIHLARELRDICREARWPARGVFKAAREQAESTGLILAVRNGDSLSVEAEYLLLTLRELGLQTGTSTNTTLQNPGTLELLVGRRLVH